MSQAGTAAMRLARLMDTTGPIPISTFMAEANAHYYGTRDPLGAEGDFITAPEISQMFGELIGLWCADLWVRAGSPNPVHYVEYGPGRGSLAADALRAMAGFGLKPQVHLVETSETLRAAQARHIADVSFHNDSNTLPCEGPLLIVANEFFDALPIRQLVKTPQGWRERLVAHKDACFFPVTGTMAMDAAIPPQFLAAEIGSLLETAPSSRAIMQDMAARVAEQGGAILAIDYGYQGPALGNTLQAVRNHLYSDPFTHIGEQDLTAHVDFTNLASAAKDSGLRVSEPVGQGQWLRALGLDQRAARLAQARPERTNDLKEQVTRLADDAQMGRLFKVLAAVAPDWPVAEGFAG